jgi:hypothetical protein
MATKYDYQTLERQFVQGTMSVRQLCKDNDIATWSTVHEYAKRNAWNEKRERYQERLREAETKTLVERRADQLGKALDDSVTVAVQAIWTFLDSLRDRWVTDPESGKRVLIPAQTIGASDFVKIMEKLMVLNGQATSREARVGLTLTGEVSPDQVTMEMLRELAATARERGADIKPSTSSPLPRVAGPRQVN